MRLLVLTGLFLQLLGCATTPQPVTAPDLNIGQGKDTVRTKPANANSAANPASQKQESATKSRVAEAKKPATAVSQEQTQQTLSGEVLYYMFSAEVAAQRGKFGLAAALYTKAAEVTRDPRIAQQATRTAYYARNAPLSVKAATLWHELEPENIEARQVLAALLVRAGKTEEAVKHFEYILAHAQSSEQQRFMLIAALLSKEKDKQTALKVMQKLIASRQQNPNALYAYSQLAFVVGELEDAASMIKKVIQLKPGWTEAYILQSNILARQGYLSHDLEILREAVSSQEDNSKLRMFYARKLIDAKQYEEARKQFLILADDDKSKYEARYALGLLALQMNKPERAEKYFKQLIEDKSRVPESQYYLGQAYELQKNLQQALQWYRKVRNHQYTFEAELRIATILAKQGKLREARELLQNISPDSLDNELRVYLTEGELLNDAKRYQEALDLYNGALQQLSGNSRLLYARALTAEKLDKIDLAIKDLETIVEREPNNAQALNALGYTLADKTKQLKRALGYIQKAIKLSPDDAAVLDSMGWVYYRMGQYDKALVYLQRAFKKLNDAEIAAHLGEVLWVAGEHGKAREVWNSALQQAPQHDVLRNVMQKFTE